MSRGTREDYYAHMRTFGTEEPSDDQSYKVAALVVVAAAVTVGGCFLRALTKAK